MAITMQTSRKDNLLSIWSRIMHIVCFQINNVSQPKKKTYWLWSFGFSMLGCCGIRHLIGTTYLLRIDRPNSYFAWPFHGQFPIHVLIVSCPQAQIFTYSTSTFKKLIWLKRFGQFWHRVADAGRLLAFLLRLPSPWDKLKLLLYWIVLEIEAE